MKVAYVDTSCLVAVAFDEPGARRVASRLTRFDRLFSSNLLEAELRAAFAREAVDEIGAKAFMSAIAWVLPNRDLSAEIGRALRAGTLKGADLWHVACALFLAPEPNELSFLTLDRAQANAAARLGFPVL